MVVHQKSEVYDAYGNIYPCWEFPYTPFYEQEEYLIGNVKLPAETYNTHAKTRDWHEDIKDPNIWCSKCKFFPVCGGACPKSWYEGQPACPSFKYNIEDRLFLAYYLQNNSTKSIFETM